MNGSIPGVVRSTSTALDATTIAIIALSFLLFVLFLLVMVAIIRMSNAICDIRDIMRKHYIISESTPHNSQVGADNNVRPEE